jgi:hypothetical protein
MDRSRRHLVAEVVLPVVLSTCLAVAIFGLGVRAVQAPPPRLPAYLLAEPGCHEATVVAMADSGIAGQARLCLRDEGIRVTLEAGRLVPGVAYTAWLGYFDRADACRAVTCQLADFAGPDPVGVLGRLDARVAGWPDESFAADLRDLRASPGAQVILWVFSHGPASASDNRQRARQLLTPQSPRFGAPLAGAEMDGPGGVPVAQAAFLLKAVDE